MSVIQRLLAIIALAGYLANGAHQHIAPGGANTIHVGICGPAGALSQTIILGETPAEETEDTQCGDCHLPAALSAPCLASPNVGGVERPRTLPVDNRRPPRPSCFWPGAPPQGPPLL